MARNKSQTIGPLGRTPARSSRPNPVRPPPKAKPPSRGPIEVPPERGAITRWLRGAFLTNLGLKFLSLVLAVTVFLLVNTDRDREITTTVGIAYTLPDDKVLVSERIEDVHVTIKGPWRKLRGFDAREIDRINLDLRHANGGELAITPEMIHVPAGMQVIQISPRFVRVVFDKRVEKLVEITPALVDHPQHGYVVAEAKAVPATAKIRGAEGTLRALTSIRTRQLSLEGRTDSFTIDTEVVPPDGIDLEGSAIVNLQVHLDEELVTRKLPGLVVAVRGDGIDPARWKIVPGQVDVTLTGALLAVEKAKDTMVAVVKLVPAEGKAREVDVTIEGLPPGIGVKLSPERVKVVPVVVPNHP